ncbi:MAG: hypothetical protein HY207_10030 [Nitrospirae bacterium]|nr:hypothetical protein [Nitrospirota bacterium]
MFGGLVAFILFSPLFIAVACIAVYLKFATFRGSLVPFLANFLGGGLIIGLVGFVVGFILIPLVFCNFAGRDCPQGPLLGIFFTGPLGLSIGMLSGTARWVIQSRKRKT